MVEKEWTENCGCTFYEAGDENGSMCFLKNAVCEKHKEEETKIRCFECGRGIPFSDWHQSKSLASGYGCDRHL